MHASILRGSNEGWIQKTLPPADNTLLFVGRPVPVASSDSPLAVFSSMAISNVRYLPTKKIPHYLHLIALSRFRRTNHVPLSADDKKKESRKKEMECVVKKMQRFIFSFLVFGPKEWTAVCVGMRRVTYHPNIQQARQQLTVFPGNYREFLGGDRQRKCFVGDPQNNS